MQNKFKDIPGYELLYQINKKGEVLSLNYNKSGRKIILLGDKNKDGYILYRLYKNGKSKKFLGHRLVLFTFSQKINGKDYVNHKNGIKDDNNFSNLEWCTISENSKHSFDVLGRKAWNKGKYGKDLGAYRNIIGQFTKEGIFIKKWYGFGDITNTLGFYSGSICGACKGKRKSAYGYIWKYL